MIWNYRLVRHPADRSVSVRVAWYTTDTMELTHIEEVDATVGIHPSWADVGQTEVDLVREELSKFAFALDHPILDLPDTTMPCTTSPSAAFPPLTEH